MPWITGLLAEPFGGVWLPLAGFAKRLLLLGRTLRMRCARLPGPDGEALYAGEGESLAWLARLHQATPEDLGPVGLADLSSLVESRTALVYVEINRVLRPWLPKGAFRTLPWLRFVADLESEATAAAKRDVEATYGRKVRQQGFKVRLRTDTAAALAFHRDFYLPYLKWRFGEIVHPRRQAEIVSVVRRGFLLEILDRGEAVAASACVVADGSVTAVASGLRGDYRQLRRRGAMSALHYEIFRWARANGMRRVDLLRARPNANDGIVWHKERFGARPGIDPWPHTLVAVYPPKDSAIPEPARHLLVESDEGKLARLEDLVQARA